MTTFTLLESLQLRGMTITPFGENLKITGPAGVLTDADRQALKDLKPELMELLGPPDIPPAPESDLMDDLQQTPAQAAFCVLLMDARDALTLHQSFDYVNWLMKLTDLETVALSHQLSDR